MTNLMTTRCTSWNLSGYEGLLTWIHFFFLAWLHFSRSFSHHFCLHMSQCKEGVCTFIRTPWLQLSLSVLTSISIFYNKKELLHFLGFILMFLSILIIARLIKVQIIMNFQEFIINCFSLAIGQEMELFCLQMICKICFSKLSIFVFKL